MPDQPYPLLPTHTFLGFLSCLTPLETGGDGGMRFPTLPASLPLLTVTKSFQPFSQAARDPNGRSFALWVCFTHQLIVIRFRCVKIRTSAFTVWPLRFLAKIHRTVGGLCGTRSRCWEGPESQSGPFAVRGCLGLPRFALRVLQSPGLVSPFTRPVGAGPLTLRGGARMATPWVYQPMTA